CIESSPTIMHNNYKEVETSLNISLQTEDDIKRFLLHCYNRGIKRTALTNSNKEFYASNFDYIYKIYPLSISELDSTGSGDCFVAGIVYGWVNSEVFADTLKFSTALAGINASKFSVAEVDIEEIMEKKDQVQLYPVGKRTKTIDDSP